MPLLDGRLQNDGPNAAILRAVLGDYLPHLHLLAPEWIGAHAADLFERGLEDPASWPTWTTYISRGRLYDEVFRATRPWYLRAAEEAVVWREAAGESRRFQGGILRAAEEAVVWREAAGEVGGSREITHSYAEHLIVTVVRVLVSVGDKDALLETAYDRLVPSDWGRAYWMIFRAWSDADDPQPMDAVRRLVRLWEWRVSQLEANRNLSTTMGHSTGLIREQCPVW